MRLPPAVALLLAAIVPPVSAGTVRVHALDAGGHAAAGVVVWLQSAPEGARAGAPHAVIEQRDRAFVPHVLVVQTGTPVDFPNNDTVRHHVYSFSPENEFEMPLYKGAAARPVTFRHPGVVVLGCNIHDQMLGYVVVVETPYFGLTAADGTLPIESVRPGRYRAFVWTPRFATEAPRELQSLEVTAVGDTLPVELRLPVRIGAAPARRSSLGADGY